MIALETMTPCFQGLIPATFYTCSKDGIPNVAYLSHVDYVDARHVALSFQFFNKSRRNIAENPQARVRVYDPDNMQCYELTVRYVRSETSGPLFDSMFLRIETVASIFGLKGIFKLLAADVYEVLDVRVVLPGTVFPPGRAAGRAADPLFTMRALQLLSERIQRATTLEDLLDAVLLSLDELFGFRHTMISLAGESEGKLVTIASRGYPENGAGAEVRVGEGIIGTVAEARQPIRISGLLRGMLYAKAVRERALEAGVCSRVQEIPLPGLPNPASQLGIPLLVRKELIGVLCMESEEPYRFHEEDKAYAEVLGGYVAIAIQNILLQERADDTAGVAAASAVERRDAASGTEPGADRRGPAAEPDAHRRGVATEPDAHRGGPAPEPRPGAAAARAGVPAGAKDGPAAVRDVTYYRSDECVLVDGEYLIRSLPAKILWKLLNEHQKDGRVQFTNRELRLDKTLQLPEYRDNLESRLILLRRRLAAKCPDIQLLPCGRGRFRLELQCPVVLAERP